MSAAAHCPNAGMGTTLADQGVALGDLEDLAAWARARGLEALVGAYSDREFYLDAPEAFVDFVVEAMLPELADYGVDVR